MTLLLFGVADHAEISIHIPRVGDDGRQAPPVTAGKIFQSTSPAWGMTAAMCEYAMGCRISIHIPRVGDDRAECGKRQFDM